jgi:hypothetical protein
MSNLSWIKTVLLLALLECCLLLGFIFIIDPYGINHAFTLPFNQNKMLYKGIPVIQKFGLLKKTQYDNLILGTSRINRIDPKIISSTFGGTSFNLALPGSTADVQFITLKYALSKQSRIKRIIWGLDFISLNANHLNRKQYLEFLNNIDNPYMGISIYFNIDALNDSIKTIFNKYREMDSDGTMLRFLRLNDDFRNGKYTTEEEFERSMQGYGEVYEKFIYSESLFVNISSVIELCKKENIELVIMLMPIHREQYELLYTHNLGDAFERFKYELAQLSPYYDFTSIKPITQNREYFMDSSHIWNDTFKLLLDFILEKNNEDVGAYVTIDNVSQHIEMHSK